MAESKYVYDTIALFFAGDIEVATLKYQKVTLRYKEGDPPTGEQAYEVVVKQLMSEVEDFLRVGDKIGFFVFKRPSPPELSIHLVNRPFARAILDDNIGPETKSELRKAVDEWRARAASEYGHERRRYFGRKHLWLMARRSPTSIQSVQNPVFADNGHGGRIREYVDINEPCEEGA